MRPRQDMAPRDALLKEIFHQCCGSAGKFALVKNISVLSKEQTAPSSECVWSATIYRQRQISLLRTNRETPRQFVAAKCGDCLNHLPA